MPGKGRESCVSVPCSLHVLRSLCSLICPEGWEQHMGAKGTHQLALITQSMRWPAEDLHPGTWWARGHFFPSPTSLWLELTNALPWLYGEKGGLSDIAAHSSCTAVLSFLALKSCPEHSPCELTKVSEPRSVDTCL